MIIGKTQKGIPATYKIVSSDYEHSDIHTQFDMSAVSFTTESFEGTNKQITISNAEFEILVEEYLRRKQQLEDLNK